MAGSKTPPLAVAGIPVPATSPRVKSQQASWRTFYLAVAAAALLLVFIASPEPLRPSRRPRRLSPVQAEELFLSVPDAKSALAASREYATHPHLAGSKEDSEDAQIILKLFQDELGVPPPKEVPIFPAGSHRSRHSTLTLTSRFGPKHPTAWVDTYYPVLNTPLNRTLQQLDSDGNVIFEADLVEDGDPRDPEAAKYKDAVPAWHGLSFDGEATGQYVYANYGTQEDYTELLSKGVDLKGKIVITRYGRIFRGLKIKGAEELGAAGVVIYSDLRDDGYVTESNGYLAYPHGPARNPTSVQRGSVQYLSLYPGDPTTPGYPAYENAERQGGVNIPKIPSLPISWKNAQQILSELRDENGSTLYPVIDGKVSKTKLKLVNRVDTKVTPIWNTMAAIPGHIRDEVVLIGCHRDAWVMGAADPTSGTVSLREVVRGLGALLKGGWKPLRTIVISSWDGEEYGLVGSTEWGEDFHPWISDHVVSYINVDVSVSGSRWNVGGSPSLADLIKKVGLEVPHPTEPGKTLWDARGDSGPFKGNDTAIFFGIGASITQAPTSEIGALGSGSDYTIFLQRIGVASIDQGFGVSGSDAAYHYHSVYDSQYWQEVYADPTFERHVAVAKHLGLLALRLTDSFILPLNTTRYAAELDAYLDLVETYVPDNLPATKSSEFGRLRASIKTLQDASAKLDIEKAEAEQKFRELLEQFPHRRPHCGGKLGRVLQRLFSKTQHVIRPLLGLEPIEHPTRGRRVPSIPEEVLAYGIAFDGEHAEGKLPFPIKFIKAAKRIGHANKKLRSFEKGFISEAGIKDREWYKHLGVAPGKWLGYGATTFPALTEAITIEKSVSQAAFETERLIFLIDKLAEAITP